MSFNLISRKVVVPPIIPTTAQESAVAVGAHKMSSFSTSALLLVGFSSLRHRKNALAGREVVKVDDVQITLDFKRWKQWGKRIFCKYHRKRNWQKVRE